MRRSFSSNNHLSLGKALAGVLVAIAVVVYAVTALASDGQLAGDPSSGGAVSDQVAMGTTTVGAELFVAVRQEQRDGPKKLMKVFRVSPSAGTALELPAPPKAELLDGGFSAGIENGGGRPCVQFTTTQAETQIACLDSASNTWQEVAAPTGVMSSAEIVNDFAARGGSLFVLAMNLKASSQRVLRFTGGTWSQVGQKIVGKNQQIAFNALSSAAEDTPTFSRERTLKGSYGLRAIFALREGRWVPITTPLRALYGAQSGPAARASHRWFLSEIHGVPEISPFGFFVRGYYRGQWQALRPGNIAVKPAFPQGNVGSGSGGSTWVSWSEQHAVKRGKILIEVFSARVLDAQKRVAKPRRLWRGYAVGFPPLPQIAAADGMSFVVFERPVTGGSSPARVRLVRLDGLSEEIVLDAP